MRQVCEEFLAARLPLPGLAACAIRLPDGMLMHQCFDRWLSPAQLRQAIAHLAHNQDSLGRYLIEPVRTVWSFEHLRIDLTLRPDRACLALFSQNRPDLQLDAIESVLWEFANLPAA
jgi:hypothetical protein